MHLVFLLSLAIRAGELANIVTNAEQVWEAAEKRLTTTEKNAEYLRINPAATSKIGDVRLDTKDVSCLSKRLGCWLESEARESTLDKAVAIIRAKCKTVFCPNSLCTQSV